ncbi:MAG: carboxynorspermidine decarboxylase [Muribaculaceae bacterium]|nr:carboxynorspermidine decarboxylase [Muribaculaceae bacterium]
MQSIQDIQTPFYIVYEEKLRKNLALIQSVAQRAGVDIIMAFKANALWKTFPIIREYITGSTASSLNEMRLGIEELKSDVHAYCPVYTDETFPQFLEHCSHITFNTLNQFHRFYNQIRENGRVSAGLRVNPQCSVIDTDIYNPCVPGSRFGMTADMIGEQLPEGIEGLHFHALCESSAQDLATVLTAFEEQFGKYLHKVKWVNMGGGHLMTREGYDTELLIDILLKFKNRWPHIKVILEPGSAFTWRTGDLITTVMDVVENQGVSTAIIDASFACHMPDTLEMPYKPLISESLDDDDPHGIPYRLGGNSCLSGDFVGLWKFAESLVPGQRLTLEDMNHYTTVKTTMFNGIQHPSIWFKAQDGTLECLRQYTYEDYKSRMD